MPVASVKLTFNGINEYEKDLFSINTKKNPKKKEGKKQKKGRNQSATMIMVMLEFSWFQVSHMEDSWEKLIFNCSCLVAMSYLLVKLSYS